MKQRILSSVFTLIALISNAQDIKVTSGKIERFPNFKSEFVDTRNVDVWLPNDYSSAEKYAVLYMHDGQALYDATTTWNKQAWEVDETAGKLNADDKLKKFIVVGIWNNGDKRHTEYFPQKAYESLTQVQKDTVNGQLQKGGKVKGEFQPISDNYLKFLVTELKPFIDRTFSTKTDVANTFVAGSSMGGLISMYAICEYPNVFGGAACISTHWPGTFKLENNPIPDAFFEYFRTHLPKKENHKIYFDYGDQTLDALYPRLQKRADYILYEAGFTTEQSMSRYFAGKDHSEKSWAERLNVPLEFLLKK